MEQRAMQLGQGAGSGCPLERAARVRAIHGVDVRGAGRASGRPLWIRIAALAALLLVGALPAHAAGKKKRPPAREDFAQFCSRWMDKLAERERRNLKQVEFRRDQGMLVAEYTGYERTPTRCDSTVKPGKPGVGVLVYNELLYRKQGESADQAKASEPEIVQRVEVTEVFRYDGARWAY